ncbi:MAG TPA: hydroxymethylglutaryl-CoA lyase [Candidatus Paceibacterota bacterium]|nr:hydroxymethylglutaryl-CoA lyase [Verrucomicrobiota bacterium]HSA09736.1 hydroxymethylglutaryl-CoA lyase [Candidatus Paceibacterota bacterium]
MTTTPPGRKARPVILHEVGLRDGLQAEKQVVPLEQKIRWAELLLSAGVDIIQLGSFVHPGKVPQMADTDALFRHFSAPGRTTSGAILSGLVLNEKGLERGMACGVEMFCMGVSASETHSQKNTGMSVADATSRIIAMAKEAVGAGKKVQLSVQSAFGCGFEGVVPEERVLKIAEQFLSAGFRNISLADTAGHGMPAQVERLFGAILKAAPDAECTCHFHNTYGLGMANCWAALNAGVQCFESSVAGLGGCPFTKVAGGNVSTEDLVHFLHRLGLRQEVNQDQLVALARDLSAFFGREMPGMVYKIGLAQAAAASR